jgi:transposase InsO family protein
MNDTNLTEIPEVRDFLSGTDGVEFKPLTQSSRYSWIARTLKRFNYHRLNKNDKGTVRKYILKITNYSRQQLTRLISQHKESGWIGRRRKPRRCFPTRYTAEDIRLLAQTDKYHDTLSGPATKKLFERAYHIYKNDAYKRLANISVAHIYNLRESKTYRQQRQHFTKTKATAVAIGERRKPQPEGKPGYLRIDTVHQGDQDKQKGVYHINAVDEVTQMEVVCSVERISENCLIPVLEAQLDEFPFIIYEIHSDNGSEYINKDVARLLQKLLIELTKSRVRHSNDNALVESKNGSIVLYKEYLNPYVNYHRPCFFPETKIDNKGKEKKIYPYTAMMTPYEKLKSLPNVESFLKPDVTIEALDKLAAEKTDLEAAKLLYKKRNALFSKITGF